MDVVKQAWSIFLLMLEEIVVGLEQDRDLTELVGRMQKAANGLMVEVCRLVLEEKDRLILREPQRRPGWVVVRKDKRTLVMPFGEVTYTRTYYRHKGTGEYAYLADRSLGVEPYKRMEANLRAEVVAAVVEEPYRKAGRGLVSGQAVRDVLMDLELAEKPPGEKGAKKKRVARALYIEADEHYVPLLGGERGQIRLVYVHEGWRPVGRNRYALRNLRYFGRGPGGSVEELWAEVWAYVEEEYDLSQVEVIYLLGDGAAWIREGLEWTTHRRVVFLLDRYHLAKYVCLASLGDRKLRGALMEAVREAEKEKVEALLLAALKKAQTPREEARVEKAGKYILRNWEGIAAWREHGEEVGGCSVEAHIGHKYASRLSRWPCAWSKEGLARMRRLCLLKANGVSLREYVLAQREVHGEEPLGLVELGGRIREEVAKRGQELERLGNIPVLRGHKTPLWYVLHALRESA